jgi:hypothetical protein
VALVINPDAMVYSPEDRTMTKSRKTISLLGLIVMAVSVMIVMTGCGRYVFEPYDPDARYQECINRCLAEQGEEVTVSCDELCRDRLQGTPRYPEPSNQ